jgi:antitoxin VapB
MSKTESTDTAKVFMSGKPQAVRLPKKFRFSEGCDEVSVRQVCRHLILSPRDSDWEDYWTNSTRCPYQKLHP